ncbi:hypothetical protein EI94DRAFT_1765002 [Lactarius quietus]|nr:hypothetical protein EI94DRAFT_1765002 [Lactarius quietus]
MSFISVEPQSRALLVSHSNSLLAQFDAQLQIIKDRYLAFFQERRRIETTYIDSLRNLYLKAKTVDTSYDPREEPTTTRAAWDKVTDKVEREANTRQAFVDVLDNDVIKPLISLKESNDETRKRIEEDLRISAAKYADYAENTISRLQQAYLKKYTQQDAHTTDVVPLVVPNKRFGGKVSSLFRRSQSQTQEPSKYKDGIANISLSVSDNDCRKAVGQLNDFRWIRAEYLEDAYDRLEELVFTPTVKDILFKYMDSMIITCATYDNLARSTRAEVEKSLAGRDMSDLRASFRRALSHSIPSPVLYRNYRPGANSRLIFGVPLVDLETDQDHVPKVMKMCIEEVEKRGLKTWGIYSEDPLPYEEVPLRQRLESERSFLTCSKVNIHTVATLLKVSHCGHCESINS